MSEATFGQGQRSVHVGHFSSEQTPGPSLFPRAADQRGATHQHVRVSQDSLSVTALQNVQGVIATKPPPSFLGKCKASCGLFTNLREDEMSAVTEFSGFIPLTSPPYYYLQ